MQRRQNAKRYGRQIYLYHCLTEARFVIFKLSFDKQIVRDFLERSGWDKTPPGPVLPQEVVEKTAAAYTGAYERLTGQKLL